MDPFNPQPTPQTPPHAQPGGMDQPVPAPTLPQPVPLSSVSSSSPHQYSNDYLDQIAVAPPSKAPNKFAVIGLIAGVLIAATFALILITSAGGPDSTSQIAAIKARVTTLQTVSTEQQKRLNENDIATANATLSSTLATMKTDITGLSSKKTDDAKKASAAESAYSTKLSTTLADASQRGTLDRQYTVQMTYELTVLRGMLVKLKSSSKSSKITTFATTSIANIDLILQQYNSFSATKS